MHGGETDVVRVFDENVKLTEENMRGYLKEADLEEQGFSKLWKSPLKLTKTAESQEREQFTTERQMIAQESCFGKVFWNNACQRD